MIWAILRVMSKQEVRVSEKLASGLGLTAYVPLQHFSIRRNGRSIDRRLPLIGGIVFVGGREALPWRDIREIRSVIGWYVNGLSTPYRLPQSEIDRVRDLEREHNKARSARRHGPAVGDRVRVAKGPFESVESLISAVRGPHATIEVHMLGSTREIRVPLADLAEVG